MYTEGSGACPATAIWTKSRMEMEAAWPSKDKAGKANWDS